MAADDALSGYELLDFGAGRKLERFGEVILDRPSPAAEGFTKMHPNRWREAAARYDRTSGDQGRWTPSAARTMTWNVTFPLAPGGQPVGSRMEGSLTFQLQLSPFGHVGVFPEQAVNWEWISLRVARARRPLQVLNLFAYTGGSTLAAASAGAEVVHIDAARNIVERARYNAELSGLVDCTIRWIAEDALKFCRREVKRGNHYDAVILDPPSYGHGPKGEPWKIERDLPELLTLCGTLTRRQPAFVLATCHTPGIGPAELAAYLADGIFGHCSQPAASDVLALSTSKGRRLPSGVVARWPAT